LNKGSLNKERRESVVVDNGKSEYSREELLKMFEMYDKHHKCVEGHRLALIKAEDSKGATDK